MELKHLPLKWLVSASWNSNRPFSTMPQLLEGSLLEHGVVQNLVVRPLGDGVYEVISGNQRLQALRELGYELVPCVVVHLSDARARLLAQVLNRVHGEDDLGLKAELIREVLAEVPQEEVLSVIPETTESLNALASLGQQDMAAYLRNRQAAQSARLKHLAFQFVPDRLETIEEALAQVLPEAKATAGSNPNIRGTALYLICQRYLNNEEA